MITRDEAVVNADGTKRIPGRVGRCINTGGLEASPYEVEIGSCDCPAVTDALISGLFARTPARQATADRYKCPRRWTRVQQAPRTLVGRPDYQSFSPSPAPRARTRHREGFDCAHGHFHPRTTGLPPGS